MKTPKIIKADFRTPEQIQKTIQKPVQKKVPDLVLNFASDEKVYTLWVPSEEMGKVAKMFCDLMDQNKIIFRLEERKNELR